MDLDKNLGLVLTKQLTVGQITPDEQGASLGITIGSRIRSIDGITVKSLKEVASAIAAAKGRGASHVPLTYSMADPEDADGANLPLGKVSSSASEAAASKSPPRIELATPGLFELTFADPKLGFGVRCVQEKGLIVVAEIADVQLQGKICPNDTVVAVNGSPIGFITDQSVRHFAKCLL